MAVDNNYKALGYDYLTELASAFRESLEQEVLASRQKAGIDDKVLAPSYQAVYRLSDDLGLARAGFHDGLHQVTVIGWKSKRMHLVQCRDNYRIDIEVGACGTEVRKVFGYVLANAHIPFAWTSGITGQFVETDVHHGVSLKAESAPAEEVTELTEALLQSIAKHVRSRLDWVASEITGETRQSVELTTRNGERIGVLTFAHAGAFDVRIAVALRDGELQRVTCMQRLDGADRPFKSGPCDGRVREVFGFSL